MKNSTESVACHTWLPFQLLVATRDSIEKSADTCWLHAHLAAAEQDIEYRNNAGQAFRNSVADVPAPGRLE